jgi:hypothetical protein
MEIVNKEIVGAAKPAPEKLALLKGKDILSRRNSVAKRLM